ncbi:MAG: tetratricopeptide repeat protein [Terriglobales bacterium]
MKKSLVAIVLAFAGLASGQQTDAQPPAQSGASPAAQAQPQKKEIKDPAEYNAYVGAVQQSAASAKISGLEAFLVRYPNSVMKEDALEVLMGAYQQAGNQAKVMDTANRLLATNPNNVRALVLLAYNERAAQKWADAKGHAERGLQALPSMPKPDGASDADFAKQKGQLAALLEGVAGFSALQLKDNATAEKDLRMAVEADPNNAENVYPLALAYLTATPEDDVNGLFFIARAANLVKDPAGKAQIIKFGHSKYAKYHGSDEGWNDLLTMTATTPLPPADFTVKQYVPPTPAEQAHDLVKDKTPADIKKLSFAEWELVLSAGAPEDAAKVWSVIKGVPLQMEATVLKAGPLELEIAASQDDIDAKRADIVLTMTGTIPAKLMPEDGSTLDFEGTPVSYTPSPFVMTMEKGALLTKAAPKKPPVHHRRSR